MFNVNQITSQLAKMPDPMLQKYAAMHKNDPYTVSLALAESNRRKAMRVSAQAKLAGVQQPTVVDQDIAEMAAVDPMGNVTGALPENLGIGRLPAPNMAPIGKAEGGIIGFKDKGLVTNPYDPNAVFEQAVAALFEREGGETVDQGGRTKYGISAKGHPNVDLDKLTKEEAKRIYKRDYWDANKLGDMAKRNPKLAAAALDTFVNHRYDFAKQAVNNSGGDVNKLLEDRLEEYNRLAETNPKVHGSSLAGWNNRLMNLASSVSTLPEARDSIDKTPVPVGTAQAAADVPQQDARLASLLPRTAAGLATLGGTAAVGKEALTAPMFRPGTTVGQALGKVGTAASVPLTTGLTGLALSKGAANALTNATPEQLEQLQGDIGSDTGLAAAITKVAKEKTPPATMPYGQQMLELGKRIVSYPTGGLDKEKTIPPMKMGEDLEATDRSLGQVQPTPEIKKPPEPPEVTKESAATGSGGLASLFKDPAFLMGMRLLANKNPNLFGAVGEAGIGTVGDVAAAEKAASESEYRKAMGKYYGAYGEAIERGAKEKNEVQLAEKSAQEALDTWAKNNKMLLLQSPDLYDKMRNKYRMDAYNQFGIKMAPALAQPGPSQNDPLGILGKG